jgi:hypothetical protein
MRPSLSGVSGNEKRSGFIFSVCFVLDFLVRRIREKVVHSQSNNLKKCKQSLWA